MQDEVKHFTDVWFTKAELEYLLKLMQQDAGKSNIDKISLVDLQVELEVLLKQFK